MKKKLLLILSLLSINLIYCQSKREITIVNKLPVDFPIILMSNQYTGPDIQRVIPKNESLKINVLLNKDYELLSAGTTGQGPRSFEETTCDYQTVQVYTKMSKNIYTLNVGSCNMTSNGCRCGVNVE